MATSAHVLAFNRALSQARNTAKRARDEVRLLSVNRKAINKVGKSLSLCLDEGDDLSLYLIGEKPYFTLTFQNLEGFKCLKLESTLWMLETIGTSQRTYDYPEYYNREYVYDVDGMQVKVNAYVKSDSPTCKRIPIGTQTETRIKYKMQCD